MITCAVPLMPGRSAELTDAAADAMSAGFGVAAVFARLFSALMYEPVTASATVCSDVLACASLFFALELVSEALLTIAWADERSARAASSVGSYLLPPLFSEAWAELS